MSTANIMTMIAAFEGALEKVQDPNHGKPTVFVLHFDQDGGGSGSTGKITDSCTGYLPVSN
ncbi:MAG: hypothetical protein LBR08_11335 [Bacteroidales bacterium]|nr:hypothetical protein [Bacteroidales bacterium]